MGPGSNVGGMRQVRGGSAICVLVSSRCSSPRCQRCSRAVLVRRRNGEEAATTVVTAAGNSGDVNSMKGFVLQPCDLICEPASPALSEARERQVAKSAAVINPSRLHPTLRCTGTLCDRRSSSPVGANIYFTSLIASTLLESRVCYTSGGTITATHTSAFYASSIVHLLSIVLLTNRSICNRRIHRSYRRPIRSHHRILRLFRPP